jgi:hypothetical protein
VRDALLLARKKVERETCSRAHKSFAFPKTTGRNRHGTLEVTCRGNHVLLVNIRPCRPLESAEPIHRLDVVGIGPERMEGIVRSHRDVRVVPNKAATELIPCVDGMGGHRLIDVRRQVSDHIVEPGIVDVIAECLAVGAAQTGRAEHGTGLPW